MLSLSIKDGDGFTIGDNIIVRLSRDPRGYGIQAFISAPTDLKINRVDRSTAKALAYQPRTGDETPKRTEFTAANGVIISKT